MRMWRMALVSLLAGAALFGASRTVSASGAPAPAPAVARTAVTVSEAISSAVTRRLGAGAVVELDDLKTIVADEHGLEAIPEPSARSGRPVRFTLVAGGARRGTAVVSVTVLASYPRAAQAMARGEIVTSAMVEIAHGTLAGVTFDRLPAIDEVIGLRSRRAIVAGEPLTRAVLDVPPLVRSGDHVTVALTLGAVRVTTEGVASGSGFPGDVVSILQPGIRRPLKARVVERGMVEVIP